MGKISNIVFLEQQMNATNNKIYDATMGYVQEASISRFWFMLLIFPCIQVNGMSMVKSVKNLRPVVSGGLIYRSASLDDLSVEDAELLLSSKSEYFPKPLIGVIDLRNQDEVEKGKLKQTEGSKYFYSPSSSSVQFHHVPILQDVNAFWDEAISRMDPTERVQATLKTIVQGGALDRAAARHLERGGCSALYTVMMASCSTRILQALQLCLNLQQQHDGVVLFHCQKGKDRTGVLAMLLQSCYYHQTDENICQSYALSANLLGEEKTETKTTKNDSGLIDWSHFRGSPIAAMEETLQWTRQTYGSIDAYLDQNQLFDKKLLQKSLSEKST